MFVLHTKGYGTTLRTKDMRLFTKIEEYLDFASSQFRKEFLSFNDYLARAYLADEEGLCREQFQQFLVWHHRLSILIPGELAPPARTLKPKEIWEQMVEHGRDKALFNHVKTLYLTFLSTWGGRFD